jgi:hypothetical protein
MKKPPRKNAKARLAPGNCGKAKKSQPKYSERSSATEAQIERLIDLLRTGRRHTHELRKHGISHPAGRVQDLEKRGFVIASSRTTTVDTDGFTHRGVALYELRREPIGGAA